jgi:hypothetical protein
MPVLPELRAADQPAALDGEYSSRDGNLEIPAIRQLLADAEGEIREFAGA